MVKQDVLKIGIIGLGFVGRVIYDWFAGNKIYVYDKHCPGYQVDDINKADIIFICVPTPYTKKGFDDSAIIESLKKIDKGKIVVIKSTILPGSTRKYQKQFHNLKILFNPEFLAERTAKRDFEHPNRQIIGYTRDSKEVAGKVMEILPKAPYNLICLAEEAEMAKYMANTFLATKVIFANQMFDICAKSKMNYEIVRWIVGRDPRIGESHLNISTDGYRGYDGKCLPKDTKALIQYAKKQKVTPMLLEVVDKINKKYVG